MYCAILPYMGKEYKPFEEWKKQFEPATRYYETRNTEEIMSELLGGDK